MLGWTYLLNKQYPEALDILKQGEDLDSTNLVIKGNMAHAYLLLGKFETAKEIYLKYKGMEVYSGTTWKQMVIEDFEKFRSIGIESDKFDVILELVEE